MIFSSSGTRLYPATQVGSYAGWAIREILIISTPQDLPILKRLLETGDQWGVQFSFQEQPSPDGLAQAFVLGEEFIGDQSVCLILGDNVFFGQGLLLDLSNLPH